MKYFFFRGRLYRWYPRVFAENLLKAICVLSMSAFYVLAFVNAIEGGLW